MYPKLHRKISILILVVFILTTYLTPLAYAVSSDEIIWEERSSEVITSGVTHEKIKRFLTSGWLNINIMKVDLTNPYIKLDLLTSPEGISTLANVKTMAESSGAVAAINADFFDKFSNPNRTDSSGYPIGFNMKSGSIVSTPHYEGGKFASFSMDNLKNILYSYVAQTITLTAPNGSQIKIGDINKISNHYKYPIIYNKFWNKYSIGSSEKFPDMVEMVVNNGAVTEIRSGLPPVEIPDNGYVVSARLEGAKSIVDTFHVGDSVQLDIHTTPDLGSQDFAIGGGALLIKDGHTVPLTHNISGLHPRSAIGTSGNNKYLYMVTVDGRQTLSQGVTLDGLANIMLEIGASNAINFDGGGSTTLVERLPASTNIGVVNSPSDSGLRKVIDSLGVFTTAPQGTLNGLIIDTIDTNIFAVTKRKFMVRGYDEYYNPVQLDPAQVSWKLSGIKGSFENNILTAQEVGEGTVTASVGSITNSIPVSILSPPVEISMSPRVIKTSVGKHVNFSIKGKNKNGYYAVIDPSSLKWTLTNDIVSFADNTFTAERKGNAIVSCSLDQVTAFAGISVSGEAAFVIQPCEEPVVTFKSYPSEVIGEAAVSSEQKHSGSASYKLSYDFTTTDKTRAAYMAFPEKSINIDENTTDIGLWIYNPSPKSDWLKAQLIDSNGSTHLIDISRDLSWTGWKFIKMPLDEDLPRPLQLSRMYTVQIEPSIKSLGEIYIDDITLYSKTVEQLNPSDIPANITLLDSAEKEVTFKSNAESFQFAVVGKIGPTKTLLDKIYMQKLTEYMNNKVELSALAGSINNEFYKSVKKPVVTSMNGNSTYTYKNSTFISLDNSKGSIRKTDYKQWKWFASEMDKVKTDNVFILLPQIVSKNDSSDPYEAELFQSIITDYRKKTKRNVWVISGGNDSRVSIERGTRNASTAGIAQNAPDVPTYLDQSKYILMTVKGKEITYQIKNLF